MTDLNELLERVKKAHGPDRALDCRLSHHFDRKGIYYGTGDDSGWAPAATVDGWDDAKWASMQTEHVSSSLPHFTASIDAALALVARLLPGWRWGVSDHSVKTVSTAMVRMRESPSTLMVFGLT